MSVTDKQMDGRLDNLMSRKDMLNLKLQLLNPFINWQV